MALAKDPTPYDSHTHFANLVGESSLQVSDLSSQELYGFDEHHKNSGFNNNFAMSSSSSISSPSSTNSDGLVYKSTSYLNELNFKNGYNNFMQTSGSLLSFEQNEDEYSVLDQNLVINPNTRLMENFNCIQSGSSTYGSVDDIQELGMQESSFHKRSHMGESMQAIKKQCTSATRKPKPKSTQSKDPQSIAAKNRRERISERLKVLQDLVPNGSKVDLVTMLEKAISYVKFLQLQVKVLATDELWPVQGGKAPELSQVKDAIDAILTSQRDRNSSSK